MKIFHCNTVKVSSCCMNSMSSIISSHSKQVLQPYNKNYGCSCMKKKSCSLENKCLMPNITYEAQITNNTNDKYKKYQVRLKHHLRKYIVTTHDILNIKSI